MKTRCGASPSDGLIRGVQLSLVPGPGGDFVDRGRQVTVWTVEKLVGNDVIACVSCQRNESGVLAGKIEAPTLSLRTQPRDARCT